MKSSPSKNRRNFLRLAALAPLAPTVPAQAFAPIRRTAGAFIKPTLNAYSFLEALNSNMKDASKGIDLFGVVNFCAQHNIEAVDLTAYFLPGYPVAPDDSYITDDPYADIAMMVPHAVNWQIKETLGSTLNSPRADFRKLAKVVSDGGYRGFVPIETLAMGRRDSDPAAEVVTVLVAIREAIASLK